jgi:molecular chaperone GrpE
LTSGSPEARQEPAEAAPEPPPDPVEVARQEAARFKDQLLRTAADFDNFRTRSRKENVDAERKGRDDILRDLLPVFDNLERAAAHMEKATDVQSVAEGIHMVLRQFIDTLGKMGVERVTTVGQAFDPALHEAIQQVETAEHPPGTVAHEVQAGYRTTERLIRPAMVVVAKAPTE